MRGSNNSSTDKHTTSDGSFKKSLVMLDDLGFLRASQLKNIRINNRKNILGCRFVVAGTSEF